MKIDLNLLNEVTAFVWAEADMLDHSEHSAWLERVDRLENGEAISTAPKANTVRSVSRVRIVKDEDGEIVLRCAQNLREFRKENLKHYTADVTFHLVRDSEQGFKINRKIINLVNSTDTLAGISYIL